MSRGTPLTEPVLEMTSPRSALRLLFTRDFGTFFWGKLLGAVGAWAYSLAAAIIVYEETASTLAVAAIGVAQFSPQLLLSPLSGSWADRGHARLQLLLGRFICAGSAAGLGFWMLVTTADGWAMALPVILTSGFVGIGIVLGGPAMQSVVTGIVRPTELRVAVTLNTAPMTIGRFAGPLVGAVTTATLGPAWSIMVFAVSQAVFGLCLLVVRFPQRDATALSVGPKSIRGAARHAWQDKRIRFLLIATAVISLGSEPALTLSPAIADSLSGGPELVGALTASFGLGAAIGLVLISTVLKRFAVDSMIFAGLCALAGGVLVAGVSSWPVMSTIGFAIAGVGMSTSLSMVSTALQEDVPAEMRGRIMGFWLMCFMGSRPLGATFLGFLADFGTVHLAIVSTAVVVAVVAGATRYVLRPVH